MEVRYHQAVRRRCRFAISSGWRGTLVRAWIALIAASVFVLAGSLADAVAKKRNVSHVSSALDNGLVKVGIDLGAGGSISYLSLSGSPYNLVNIHDKGRYVQQSYYAGQSLDRTSEGQYRGWSPFPWNPIQGGDTYGHPSPVRAWSNDGSTIYVKTDPLLWDMNGEACQCHFQTWITLEGRRVRVRNKLTSFRTDSRWAVVSRLQELPAVYAIADLNRVFSFTGGQPFRGHALTQIADTPSFWESWNGTEHWGACVNSQNFGLGVYNPPRISFSGGLYVARRGGWDASTCYLAPNETVTFNKTSIYDYEYYLTIGTLDEIRREAYELDRRLPTGTATEQTWGFDMDGHFGGWEPRTTITPVSVQSGSLNGRATDNDPFVVSPIIAKSASSLKKLIVRLRNDTASTRAQLFFQTLANRTWSESMSKAVSIRPNSDFTEYTFDMSSVPAWAGTITQLRLDPIAAAGNFRIDWIRIRAPGAS